MVKGATTAIGHSIILHTGLGSVLSAQTEKDSSQNDFLSNYPLLLFLILLLLFCHNFLRSSFYSCFCILFARSQPNTRVNRRTVSNERTNENHSNLNVPYLGTNSTARPYNVKLVTFICNNVAISTLLHLRHFDSVSGVVVVHWGMAINYGSCCTVPPGHVLPHRTHFVLLFNFTVD